MIDCSVPSLQLLGSICLAFELGLGLLCLSLVVGGHCDHNTSFIVLGAAAVGCLPQNLNLGGWELLKGLVASGYEGSVQRNIEQD